MAQGVSGDPRRPAWIEVNLDAIAHNYRLVRARVGPGRRLLAVVKANAYGHGAVPVARRLEAEGADILGVAIPEEGLELRAAEISAPILVMGAADPGQIPAMIAAGLTPTAFSVSFLEAIIDAGHRAQRPILFHLKLDTGMGRLGLLPGDLPGALARLAASRGHAIMEGVFTTLSSSDDPRDPFTGSQLEVFASCLGAIRAAGQAPGFVHAANSGGIIDHMPSWLETVRPGIMLYGLYPSDHLTRLDLKPALAIRSRLVLVKRVPEGTPIGYGRSFICARPSVIGTVALGYADGLSRLVSTRGHALVRGRPAPYVGRISMDYSTVDLTDISGAAEGDDVVVLGRQGDGEISGDDLARWSQTISYEILSRLGPRLCRIHLAGGAVQESL